MTRWNQDVPQEAYTKCLLQRNKQLEAKIENLQAKLDAKERAISAFKKWQSRVAQYHFEYWLNEALEFLGEDAPEKKSIKKIKAVLSKQKTVDEDILKLVSRIEKNCEGDEETLKKIQSLLRKKGEG